MLDYPKASYTELKDYKAPLNSYFHRISMSDSKKIRLFYCKPENIEKSKGTILLQQGHNEFIEKYFELIEEFKQRGYSVVSFDWRGQGLSDRMINNTNKQYIENFDIYNDDLTFIMDEIIHKNFPKPLIGFGHSMGGCIMLSSLQKHSNDFDSMILSAPMLGFRNENILSFIFKILYPFVNKSNFMIGSKPNMGKEITFEKNDLTSDKNRYLRTQKLVRNCPKLRLWGVTYRWVNAALKRLNYIRKSNWLKEIDTKVLILNSISDRVVDSSKTLELSKRIKNCKIINFEEVEHEIYLEKDIYRNLMWQQIDTFIK